uniref:Transposase n=1 Tax=Heterorhabditis bacteriophora TaxID=37862 RepID=A0A1I7XRH4_HETBA
MADHLLCVSAIPTEVRNRLRCGFRLFMGQPQTTEPMISFDALGRCVWKTPRNGFLEPQCSEEPGLCLSALKSRGFASFLRASKALRKPLTTSGWTRPELPSGKGRGKLTTKLIFLGVFQTHRPSASKLIVGSVVCGCPMNSRNPHLSLFRTSVGIALTHNKWSAITKQLRRPKSTWTGSEPRPPHPTAHRLPLDHDHTHSSSMGD